MDKAYVPTIIEFEGEGDPCWEFVLRDCPTVTGQTFAADVEELISFDGELIGFRIFKPSATPEPVAPSREEQMVVVSRKGDGTPDVWCDPEVADLVSALNRGGIRTVASCSGHGQRPGSIALEDGRELLIASSFDEARQMDAAFSGINGEPVAPPSPDIAGLVEQLKIGPMRVGDTEDGEYELFDIQEAEALMFDAATALQRVAQERDAANATISALRAEVTAADRHMLEWASKAGVSQGLLTAAEARLSSARDEGREEVAEWLHQNGNITLAAAIRVLKGTRG